MAYFQYLKEADQRIMQKEFIRKTIAEMQEQVIADLETSYERLMADANIDEAETRDPEDFSHQTESGEMARRFKYKIVNARNALSHLNGLPAQASDEVTEGSLVITDRLVFFVGISTKSFQYDEKQVVGISTESPIYPVMRGLQRGDSFSYANKDYQILELL